MALASELHGPRHSGYGGNVPSERSELADDGIMHDEAVKSFDVDRRGSRRLELRLPVELRMADGEASTLVRTITRNISTGGLYFELDRADFSPGDRLNIELTVPPAEGVSPYPGRASCTAEVVRCTPLAADSKTNLDRVGIAARFLDRLRITY